MKALVLEAERQSANVKRVPAPRQPAHELLIRVEAVALNPIDSLYVYNPLASTGRIIGSDFAGVIDALGDGVPPTSRLKPGDRVAGFLQGACSVNERPGAFANYLVCLWDLVWKVDDGMRLQEAAAVSLCGLTVAQALFFRMDLGVLFQCLERPALAAGLDERGQTPPKTLSFFIYGASTSVGLVERENIRLFGTAGPKHFEMLNADLYGYDGLLDYHDEDWPAKVHSFTNETGVDYAYDCISEGGTVSKAAGTLAPRGKMTIVRSREGGAWTAPDLLIEPSYVAVLEGFGEVVQYQGMNLPASQEARNFAVAFYKWLSEGGRLKPNHLREMPGGLENIVDDGFRL